MCVEDPAADTDGGVGQDGGDVDSSVDGGEVSSCELHSDCDDMTATRGYLCVQTECVPCTQDAQCLAVAIYGSGTVCSENGRCQMAPSCVDVGCPDGGVCEEATGECREPFTCAQVDCMEGQLCQAATADSDAECLEECEQGMVWNGVDGICEVIPPNCREDWDNSILDTCTAQLRICDEWEDGAECGECFPGYRDDGSGCVPVTECEDLSCEAQNRVCVPAGDHTDAYCGDCMGGYSESFGTCSQAQGADCDPNSPSSILAQCAEQHRLCEEAGDGAACGDCAAGYVEDPSTGTCEPERTCAEINCEAQNRECTDTWNAECGDCLPLWEEDPATGECVCIDGYLPDEQTGECVPIRTCADIDSDCTAAGQICIEATATHHAYCRRCFEDQAWYDHWDTCLPCPPCTLPGQTGRVYPITTLMGHCVCETQEGYYHSESGLGGTVACDADGDGWVTSDARTALEAPEGSAQRENARCDLRKIDRFVLVNETGEATEVHLSGFSFLWDAVPLYEPVNRDRQDKLVYDYDYSHPLQSNYAPPLGDGGRYLRAEELNPLTKACAVSFQNGAARYADFNANGVADVDEEGLNDNHADPEVRIFSMFSYFMELHRGWYEHPEGEAHGRWIIQERGRGLYEEDSFRIPLTYSNPTGYWRECRRFRDTAFSPNGPYYTMDFAAYGASSECDFAGGPDSYCGMNHHSQFKCMLVTNTPDPQKMHHMYASEVVQGYEANTCVVRDVGSFAPVTPGAANPSGPPLECETGQVPGAGYLVWGAARYHDYGDDQAPSGEYLRGCINECAEVSLLPPEKQCQGPPGPPEMECNGRESDFGRLTCFRPLVTVDVTPLAGSSFEAGSPETELGRYDNEPLRTVHFVEIPGLEVTTTEITQDRFEETIGYNPSRFDCGNSVCPVEQVTHAEAMAFANELSISMGYVPCYDISSVYCFDGTLAQWDYDYENNSFQADYCVGRGGMKKINGVWYRDEMGAVQKSWECEGFRLPSGAEWEYLARAGSDGTVYGAGELTVIDCALDPVLDPLAWYCGNAGYSTGPSGVKTPNAFGLYDMLGNVWEWTIDAHEDLDPNGTFEDPEFGSPDYWWVYSTHMLKGGAWNRGALDSRPARRVSLPREIRNHGVGFRLVRTLWDPDRYDPYVYVSNAATWQDAEDDCVSRGGHLVSIGSELENRMVSRVARRYGGYDVEPWIGFTDSQMEDTWVWSDGSGAWVHYESSPYTGWYYQIYYDSSPKDCAYMDRMDWGNDYCHQQRPYVCEIR
jgi:formylglycine-generating enzyme required for sulfatase activity